MKLLDTVKGVLATRSTDIVGILRPGLEEAFCYFFRVFVDFAFLLTMELDLFQQ